MPSLPIISAEPLGSERSPYGFKNRIRKGDHGSHKGGLSAVDKWEFGGESPLTMRA